MGLFSDPGGAPCGGGMGAGEALGKDLPEASRRVKAADAGARVGTGEPGSRAL